MKFATFYHYDYEENYAFNYRFSFIDINGSGTDIQNW